MEVCEEAERVQEDDVERGERERDKRSPASGTSERDSEHADDDPHPRPREPPGELVEAKAELGITLPPVFAPVVVSLVFCFAAISALDVIQGAVTPGRVAIHAIAALQALLVWRLARTTQLQPAAA